MSRAGEAVQHRPPQGAAGAEGGVFNGQVDPARAHQDLLRGLDGKQVCPFCGSVSEKSGAPCQRCGMDNTPDARKATKARIGPWYVLQARNPAAPGMRFETLLSFVRKGRVRARSVVRGPTTHQLWRFAAHVKGLSREFGLCFSCGSPIETTANVCPQCNRLQEPPINPDVLLEEHGGGGGAGAAGEDAARPVYRELPEPARANGAARPVAVEAAPAPPPPEDVDIIIPALGGFGPDDLDTKFSDAPVKGHVPPAAAAAAVVPPSFGKSSPPPPGAARPAARTPGEAPVTEDNPFAIAPPAPGARKKGNGDGSFLSAKELAAAFKLSFDPGADMDAVDVPDQLPAGMLPDGMRPGALGGAGGLRQPMGLPAAPAAVTRPGPRRRGGLRKFVLFCLILAATGFGVLMWVDPAFRAASIEWGKATVAKLQAYANGADKRETDGARGGATPPAAAPDEFDVPAPAAPSVEPTSAPATAPALPEEPSGPRETPDSEPQPQPAAARPDAVTEPPTVVPAMPAPREAKRTSPPVSKSTAGAANARPQAPTPAPPPADAAKPSAGVDTDEIAKASTWRQLYRIAGRAEQRGDYVTALRAFEKVKMLPADQQPTSIDLNLSRVRREVKK